MCTKVCVVGIGPGNKKYIVPEAVEVMENSDLVIGFNRAIKSLDFINANKMEVKKLNEILDIINSNKYEKVSIAASGDPLFYGVTDYITKNYKGELEVVPGLSSFQYMMAKIKKSWQGTFLGSLHGREDDFYNIVDKNKVSIWLTDSKHSPSHIAEMLLEKNIKSKIYVGENLSYEDERITEGKTEEIANMKFSSLCVVVVEKL